MRVFPRIAFAAVIVVAASLISTTGASAAEGLWSTPDTLSAAGQTAIEPHMASAGGTTTVVWTRSDGSHQRTEVASSTDGGATWGAATALSAPGQHSFGSQVVSDGTTITAIWIRSDGTNDRVQASSSTDGGATWSAAATLSASGDNAFAPQLVTDGTTVTAIWYRLNGVNARVQAAYSTDGGVSWSSPVANVSQEGGFTLYEGTPQLVTDGTIITAVWAFNDGSNFVIQTSSSTDGGATWSAPVRLSDAGQNSEHPQLVTDGTTITAVWSRNFGVANRIQVSSSTDGGVSWGAVKTLSPTNESAKDPLLVTDGTTLTVVWESSKDSISRVRASWSGDGGATWGVPVTVSDAGRDASKAQIVSDSTTITAVWSGSDGSNSRVQEASSTNGGAVWTSPVTLSEAGQSANYPVIVQNDTGLSVAWRRSDGANFRVQVSTRVDLTVSRLAGSNRYLTAVEISQQFAADVPVAYLATGTNFPDALSAASAAARQGGPLLLTPPTALPQEVRDELQRLNPTLVVIVGGTGVVSAGVESDVAALLPSATVRRDAGSNRYATSRQIAEKGFLVGSTTSVFIATGADFPDALSASAAAGDSGMPVVLVNGNGTGIDTDTQALFATLGVTDVYIAGGTGVVSVSVENALKAIVGSEKVVRLAGGNRYATSVAINSAFFGAADTVFLATGLGYADALAGAALAGSTSAPLLLVPGSCVPISVLAEIASLRATMATLLGGTGALSVNVEDLSRC